MLRQQNAAGPGLILQEGFCRFVSRHAVERCAFTLGETTEADKHACGPERNIEWRSASNPVPSIDINPPALILRRYQAGYTTPTSKLSNYARHTRKRKKVPRPRDLLWWVLV